MDVCTDHQQLFVVLREIISDINFILLAFYREYRALKRLRDQVAPTSRTPAYTIKSKIHKQIEHLHDLISFNDETCIANLRMSRNAFGRLCYLLESVGGLCSTKNVQITEQVGIFLSILAHHKKNVVVKHDFKRSGYTISAHFNNVLTALLRLHTLFLVKPQPIEEHCTNDRWKWFQGCLGALDGTYIPLREGSAADSRVLKDAITRANGFRIPDGNYYLCDSGYTNGQGFLAPYQGVRYHIQEWNSQRTPPQNAHELFNKVHAMARNVIERSFALLKGRWSILRSNFFYPVKVQNRIIMACGLLHNFIRTEMPYDPLEAEIPEVDDQILDDNDVAFIGQVEPSQQWSNWRENLATNMMNRMRGGIANGSASKNCRRCWTVEEEKALADAMKDLVVRGYKADSGFKSGYQNLLEQAMMQAFPGTTLKAEPHINSRITVWSKNYASISTMLTRSGFGFNSTTNMITVESQEVWDNYIKVMKLLNGTIVINIRTVMLVICASKRGHCLGDWVEIFGKDRATGEGAEGFADVVQQLFTKDANLEQGKDVEDGGDYVLIFNNSRFDEVESMSVSNANTSGNSKSDKRKRKLVDENDARFINLMSSFCDKTDNRLGDISRRIGFEHDASISRKAIFEAIGEVTSLDMESMIMVSQLIVKNTKNMDLFFNLPNNGRKTMVKMILEGKFPGNDTVA
ncbi:hypothetical protein BUALT_Bualt13G0081500 [Buddleja alternifolia]|uniref:DDE Tnp4 domain-containing protein n=1 Tax=Buddleja alternifolia TaxID=168488 RepID=A0AAV6WSW9_9LAMI|nr:hypothetical protein BUALT_Bualt13G0081500 [Buddleja alternifolia]